MFKTKKIARRFNILFIAAFFLHIVSYAQTANVGNAGAGKDISVNSQGSDLSNRLLYGQASYYAEKFEGRKTATGEVFRQSQMTAACNVLPLGTWVRVTNLKNGKSIVVRTNDRLHVKTRRIVDLTRFGAQQLGYIKNGLTRVKVEVLNQKPYKKLK